MRVTLIRPRTGNTPDPPLGLMILSACARQAGHTVQIIDPNADDMTFIREIEQFNPDIVGYSILTTQVSRTRSIHEQVRTHLPGIPAVAGGIHPTALPEWTLRNLGMDYVVRGEGERTFIALLAALESGSDPAGQPGLGTLRSNLFIDGPPAPFITDLDTVPLPDRESVDFNRYLRPPGNIRGTYLRRATSIITSRGCPFGCTFCSSHGVFGRTVRRRSVGHVMREIRGLIDRYQIDGLWFLDDTLLESPDWLQALCAGMKETGLPWACQAHVRRADETMFRIMKDAGCRQLEFGVESGSPAVLRRLKKGSTPDDVRRAFAICRTVGLRTLANFMIGVPGETEADADLSFRLAREIKPDHVVVTFVTPLPGSELFDESLEKGWLPSIPDFSNDWIIRQTENPAVALTMDQNTLKRIRKRFDNTFLWANIREYFLYPEFILDILRHMLMHPRRYWSGIRRVIRTGRLLHIVETVWEEYNRI
ncbi:B12-binding domain-containing radical SAM protein [bacterium]|nr:B12-binding domain-containing radical SAM protein [candidate division CSSED10-310 bacterium]